MKYALRNLPLGAKVVEESFVVGAPRGSNPVLIDVEPAECWPG
jgi:hypothetical protein